MFSLHRSTRRLVQLLLRVSARGKDILARPTVSTGFELIGWRAKKKEKKNAAVLSTPVGWLFVQLVLVFLSATERPASDRSHSCSCASTSFTAQSLPAARVLLQSL